MLLKKIQLKFIVLFLIPELLLAEISFPAAANDDIFTGNNLAPHLYLDTQQFKAIFQKEIEQGLCDFGRAEVDDQYFIQLIPRLNCLLESENTHIRKQTAELIILRFSLIPPEEVNEMAVNVLGLFRMYPEDYFNLLKHFYQNGKYSSIVYMEMLSKYQTKIISALKSKFSPDMFIDTKQVRRDLRNIQQEGKKVGEIKQTGKKIYLDIRDYGLLREMGLSTRKFKIAIPEVSNFYELCCLLEVMDILFENERDYGMGLIKTKRMGRKLFEAFKSNRICAVVEFMGSSRGEKGAGFIPVIEYVDFKQLWGREFVPESCICFGPAKQDFFSRVDTSGLDTRRTGEIRTDNAAGIMLGFKEAWWVRFPSQEQVKNMDKDNTRLVGDKDYIEQLGRIIMDDKDRNRTLMAITMLAILVEMDNQDAVSALQVFIFTGRDPSLIVYILEALKDLNGQMACVEDDVFKKHLAIVKDSVVLKNAQTVKFVKDRLAFFKNVILYMPGEEIKNLVVDLMEEIIRAFADSAVTEALTETVSILLKESGGIKNIKLIRRILQILGKENIDYTGLGAQLIDSAI